MINLLPMENLAWKTPYEMLFRKLPLYQDLRVIGCLCFASNLGDFDKLNLEQPKCASGFHFWF